MSTARPDTARDAAAQAEPARHLAARHGVAGAFEQQAQQPRLRRRQAQLVAVAAQQRLREVEAPAAVHHRQSVGDVICDGLLDEHVQPGLERRFRLRTMHVIWRGQDYSIEVVSIEQCFVRRGCWALETGCGGLGFVRVRIVDGGDGQGRNLADGLLDAPTMSAEADEGDMNGRVRHGIMLYVKRCFNCDKKYLPIPKIQIAICDAVRELLP